MHTFWDREKDDVRQFLADYQRVCDYLATAALEDSEVVEDIETTRQSGTV